MFSAKGQHFIDTLHGADGQSNEGIGNLKSRSRNELRVGSLTIVTNQLVLRYVIKYKCASYACIAKQLAHFRAVLPVKSDHSDRMQE